MRQALKLHPDSRDGAVTAIVAEASRPAAGMLRLRYRVEGDIPRIALPPRTASVRADELWRHTCLEAFIRRPQDQSYLELNLAPSTRWAAYSFTGYREGMIAAELAQPPRIEVTVTDRTVELLIELRLQPETPDTTAWRLGLSAVIEETDGNISYWALAHPPGRADFHHPDCFAQELPAPEGP